MSKIIGVTVGTPLSTDKIKEKIKFDKAVETALQEAKESGAFDGADGQRGTGILKITSAPMPYTTPIETPNGTIVPRQYISISAVLQQSGASEIIVGDSLLSGPNLFTVGYLDDTYAYITTAGVSIRGPAGSDGAKGDKGDPGQAGENGSSSWVESAETADGYDLTISNSYYAAATGEPVKNIKTISIKHGAKGEDGVSPSVLTEPITGGHRITIIDAAGEKSFDVMDGQVAAATSVLPETTFVLSSGGTYVFGSCISFTPGTEYTVTWNGVEYKCVCAETKLLGPTANLLGNAASKGGEDTGEPFAIYSVPMTDDTTVYAFDGSTEVTLSIICGGSGNGGGVSSWNDLTDKPFDENNVIKPEALPEGVPVPRKTVSWDGNTEGLQKIGLSGSLFYKVSEQTPAKEELLKCVIEVTDSGAGQFQYFYDPIYAVDVDYGNKGKGYGVYFDAVEDTNSSFADVYVIFESEDAGPGIYFLYSYGTEWCSYTSKLSWGVPTKIDFSCLPAGYPSLSVARTVLPETVFEMMEGVAALPDITLEVGKDYLVNYCGFEYLCNAKAASVEGVQLGVALGNSALMFGGDPSDEMFMLLSIYPEFVEMVGAETVVQHNGSTNITGGTISVREVEAKGMHRSFLPNLVVNVEATQGLSATPTVYPTDKSMGEIIAGIAAGYDVKCNVSVPVPGGTNDSSAVYNLSMSSYGMTGGQIHTVFFSAIDLTTGNPYYIGAHLRMNDDGETEAEVSFTTIS